MDFYPYPYKYDVAKFCSRECYNKSKEPKPKTCKGCNKMFTPLGQPTHKYCSRECWKRNRDVNNGFPVNYNKDSIKVIEKYGRENGYVFQHAENGGEVCIEGFFVDGYDAKNNVVVEYQEYHHRSPQRRKRDGWKKHLITKKLKCKYIEIWESK